MSKIFPNKIHGFQIPRLIVNSLIFVGILEIRKDSNGQYIKIIDDSLFDLTTDDLENIIYEYLSDRDK